MSFFGFDTRLPQNKSAPGGSKGIFEHTNPFAEVQKARRLQAFQGTEGEELDFEDTYDGLGDQLEETGDDFNEDTFGGGIEGATAEGQVGKDFDFFGKTAEVSNAIDEEQVRYNLQHMPRPTPASHKPKKTGYEKYQNPSFIPEIQAKSNVWGTKPQPAAPQEDAHRISTARTGPATTKKMMSLEEVEAAMRAQAQPMQSPPQPSPYLPPQGFSSLPIQPDPQPPQAMQHPPARLNETGTSSQAQLMSQPPQNLPQHGRMPSGTAGSSRLPQQPLQILQNPNRVHPAAPPSLEKIPVPRPVSGVALLPGSGLPVITNPQQLLELSEEQRRAYLEEDAKRAKRNHKIFLLSKGNGLMSPQDKSFITRIQLQQLVSATGNSNDNNPEAALQEDFYYQVYSQIRGAPRQHPTQPLGHFAQTYLFQTGGRMGSTRRHLINGDNHMQRMQQQVQRAVEAAKLKPKNKQLIIEGSLGKISFSNAKTPKPLLNIKRNESGDPRPAGGRKAAGGVSSSDRKTVLRNIEAVYSTLMQMEDTERRMPLALVKGQAESAQSSIEWRETMHGLNAQLWQELKVLEPIIEDSSVTHPFIAFLSFAKGKKAIPRVFHHLDQEQRVTVVTMIAVHLDQLDVVRGARLAPGETQPPPMVREEIELFSHTVMPSLLGYVSEAPINIVIGLLGLLIDRCNVVTVAKTKIGLGVMTMLLSRAELIKDAGGVSNQDCQQWMSLYNKLFDTLEPFYEALFPGPVNSGEDMYIWQFLAAVGIGASPEQQQRLVIAVKDRVMETVTQSKTLPPEMSSQRLGNVNLFMRAIGLDVEMLG